MSDDILLFLDCPKCGESIPEAADVELEYYCYDCSLAFEYAVCRLCDSGYGSAWADQDHDLCPDCAEQVAVQREKERDLLRRWNEGLGLSGRESYWI